MSASQLDLFAPPPVEAIDVSVSRDVLLRGASATNGRGEPLFPHRHVPATPPKVHEEASWLAMLDFAESARRYNQAGKAVLDLSQRGGAGSNGPISSGTGGPREKSIMAAGSKVECYHFTAKRGQTDLEVATWAQLLPARAEQRAHEPAVAQARDLAEAYHYLDYYGGVYAGQPTSGTWSAADFIERIARDVLDLGGDPTLVETRTEYMAEGIRRATGGAP